MTCVLMTQLVRSNLHCCSTEPRRELLVGPFFLEVVDNEHFLLSTNQSIQSINQLTFYVFGTHQGSQQTITGRTVHTKH